MLYYGDCSCCFKTTTCAFVSSIQMYSTYSAVRWAKPPTNRARKDPIPRVKKVILWMIWNAIKLCPHLCSHSLRFQSLIQLKLYGLLETSSLSVDYLISCYDLWERSDELLLDSSSIGNCRFCRLFSPPFLYIAQLHTLYAEFFEEIDRKYGPLLMDSSMAALVVYVEEALRKLKL